MQSCWKRKLYVIGVVAAFFPLQLGASYTHVYYAELAHVGGPTYEGVEVALDLPLPLHVKNFGAPRDGLGLCVFTSMQMDANWHRYTPLWDISKKIDEGGGWPAKVDEVLRKHAPDLKYFQYEGDDLSGIEEAIAEGRGVCSTLGYGERYGMETIAHMIFVVHCDAKYVCIIDNNFPGTFEWMSRAEYGRRAKHPSGELWFYTFLLPPPPPVPHS